MRIIVGLQVASLARCAHLCGCSPRAKGNRALVITSISTVDFLCILVVVVSQLIPWKNCLSHVFTLLLISLCKNHVAIAWSWMVLVIEITTRALGLTYVLRGSRKNIIGPRGAREEVEQRLMKKHSQTMKCTVQKPHTPDSLIEHARQ